MKKLFEYLCFLFLAVNLLIINEAGAQDDAVAKLYSVQGVAEVKRQSESDWKAVAKDDSFRVGDALRTSEGSRAAIILTDGVLIRLDSNSYLDFNEKDFRNKATGTFLNIQAGKAYFLSREPKEFPTIYTPTVTTAIRGTELTVEVSQGKTLVSVLEGNVICSNDFGQVTMNRGEMALTEAGKAPVKSVMINPENAVQWAINYPALFDLQSPEANTIKSSPDGKVIYDAARQLSAGQVQAAESILRQDAINNASSDIKAIASSQLAVIALAKNDTAAAHKYLSACDAVPNSSECALARSYLAQSEFKLNDAIKYIEQALIANPSNQILRVRMAELELSSGDVESADDLLSEVLNNRPGDVFALTIYGFVKLFKNETDEALETFQRALSIDSTSALSELGLGLTLIRKGNLEAGRLEISKAVHLDPTVSQYRSYLGKAYFEEDREKLAGREYERAIELDPKDPTPYLYRAFNQLSFNKPVEALEDVEKSIELNDNRAIYRSSLLLDKDLGVKSASLSEVFTSLGFFNAARTEAIKSVNHDYTNYSGHNLLAQSYNTILTDDAKRSETAIARLLSPLSFNLYRSQTGSDASINDYSSLFDRPENRTYFHIEALSQDDFLTTGISEAGRTEEFGYLLSYDYGYGSGTKSGDYVRSNDFGITLQYQPTYQDKLILSGLASDTKNHQEVDFDRETEFENYDVTLGYTHTFDPSSTFIFVADYGEDRNRLKTLNEDVINVTEIFEGETYFSEANALLDETSRDKISSGRATAQYVFNSSLVSFILGSQYYGADSNRTESSIILEDDLDLFTGLGIAYPSSGDNPLDSQDYYLYTTWHLDPMFDLDLGVNYTDVELEDQYITPFVDDTYHRNAFSPKFGLTTYLTKSTVIRTAYFETLRKTALEDSDGIEPTLVGGLNQRFTDLPGVRARNYGVGIDQKLESKTYFGVEGLHRHLTEDLYDVGRFDTINYDEQTEDFSSEVIGSSQLHQTQDLLRAYLYQVFSKRFVATSEYTGSFVDLTDPELDVKVDTHRTKSFLRYFDPMGWFAFTSGEWIQQNRENSFFLEDGSSDFWLIDAGLGYRLPHRHGSIVLQVNNIFDRKFELEQIFGADELIQSGTSVGLNFSANF